MNKGLFQKFDDLDYKPSWSIIKIVMGKELVSASCTTKWMNMNKYVIEAFEGLQWATAFFSADKLKNYLVIE